MLGSSAGQHGAVTGVELHTCANHVAPHLMQCIKAAQCLVLLLQDGHVIQFANASAAHMALGVFILWLGWWVLMAVGFTLACFSGFSPASGCTVRSIPPASPPPHTCRYGFNAGSTQCFYGCMPVAASIAVNTTLATGELQCMGTLCTCYAVHLEVQCNRPGGSDMLHCSWPAT